MAVPFRRSATGWQQRGGSYKKEPQITPPWLEGQSNHEIAAMNVSPCPIFTLSFMINYSNLPQRGWKRRPLCVAMSKWSRMEQTSHLAYNNDNFCPPRPFQTSSVCACWWWMWGMWWKICYLRRSPEKQPMRRTNAGRHARQKSHDACLVKLVGLHHRWVAVTYGWPWSAASCRQLFSLVLMCFSCHSKMWNTSFSSENRWLLQV